MSPDRNSDRPDELKPKQETGGPQSSAERSGAEEAERRARGGEEPRGGEPEQAAAPVDAPSALDDGQTPEGGTRIPAPPTRERRGMFGVTGSGDT
jgi:NADH-quinone oxidoreductase subunit C